MLIRINSAKCVGIDAMTVTVEVNISSGLGLHLVGLADAAVKESLLRTVTALQSLGFRVPGKKIVINLAPADMHKNGSGYDLPIALGIIAASEQLEMPDLDKYLIAGELGLDGTVRYVRGSLPMCEIARKDAMKGCILPYESACETADFDICKVYGVHTLQDVLSIVCRQDGIENLVVSSNHDFQLINSYTADVMDFSEIVGQEAAKRAIEIAAAGSHNAILVGPPGSGKSSLAKAMCRILPPMSREEALQTRKIFSVAGRGMAADCGRPFRAPHTSASVAALIGGGSDNISPGEVSLANNGILFLDEFCEIPKRTIEVLRAPMEDRKVIISRLKSKIEYPAAFTLIAATNPCPCGYYGEGDRCTCSVSARNAYLAKLSGPIMDRIDLQVFMHTIATTELVKEQERENSETVAKRVLSAREIQKLRFAKEDIFCNSQMSNRLMRKFCPLDTECTEFIEKAAGRMGLSARAVTRVIKLSRTIADLQSVIDGTPTDQAVTSPIRPEHLAEAISYRFLDKVNR